MVKKNLDKLYSIFHVTIFILLVLLIFYLHNFTTNIDETNKNTSNQITINHLIGTCPRDRQCTTPSCSLWSDINKDGLCDRAIQ